MKKHILILLSFLVIFSGNSQGVVTISNDTLVTVCITMAKPQADTVIINHYIPCGDKTPMDVYILMGQSNAQGYNQGAVVVPDSLNGALSGCLIFNYLNDSIETLQYGVNNFGYSASPAKHGIELALMKKRLQLTGDTALLIKYAVSGSFIYKMGALQDWNTGSTKELYWKARQAVNGGLGWLEQSGHTPAKITLVWMQGESDSDSLVHANAYYQNTLNLFLRLKADVPALANMQVIIVQTRNITASNSNFDTNIAAEQNRLVNDNSSWMQIVNVSDIAPSTSYVHLTSNEYNRVGIRVAEMVR